MRPHCNEEPATSADVQRVAQRFFEVARDHGSRLTDQGLIEMCQKFAEQADLRVQAQDDEVAADIDDDKLA